MMNAEDRKFIDWLNARAKQIKQTVRLDKDMPGPWDHMLDIIETQRAFLLRKG